jgi:hypothetical protein
MWKTSDILSHEYNMPIFDRRGAWTSSELFLDLIDDDWEFQKVIQYHVALAELDIDVDTELDLALKGIQDNCIVYDSSDEG